MNSADDFHRVCETPVGTMIYNRFDTRVGRSLALYGEYGRGERVVFEQLVRQGQVVLDVGAGIGVHTLLFADRVGPQGRVLAFEPQRVLFQTLCGNLALNGFTNGHCWQMALGSEVGERIVPPIDYRQARDFERVDLLPEGDGETVPLATIDRLGLPQCDLIRIDGSGSAAGILAGGRATIDRCRPVLYVACEDASQDADLLRGLDALGYAAYWHRPPLFDANNFAGNGVNEFGDAAGRGLLCIDRAVEHRLGGFEAAEVPQAA